jgi:adenylate cyclase
MRTLFHFRHFQSRLLVFFLVPVVAVLAVVYLAVTRANTSNALEVITADLQRGADNFAATIAQRNVTLAIAGDALSSDFAIREAYSTADPATILSVMDNLLGRLVSADFIVMVDDADDAVIADTLRPELAGRAPEWLALIERARELDRRGEYPEADEVVIVAGRPYHLTVLPFLTPDLVAWIGLGFEINQGFTDEAKQSIAAEVTVLFRDADQRWQSNGSTLPAGSLQDLLAQFGSLAATDEVTTLVLAGDAYVTLSSPVSGDGNAVQVVLQRSLTQQLAPFEALRRLLFTIFVLGLALLALAVLAISRKVTLPVLRLAQGARRIEAGDYLQTVDIPLQDEIGELAQAFNGMARGLAEKEKVRNLLGKVVSPEIATELLSRDIELGGEEREVTVLFADVRGFTSLCEGQSPRQILILLNEYFSAITGVIEANGGVVDKYIGDAVMALFGAPVAYSDAPARAIRTALGMNRVLTQVNARFASRGLQPISIGTGINTDRVVVGNMGSHSRLNYTVIGDGVNLASRLEGLTKRYGTSIVVSERTALAAPGFLYQELDLVRVKGKQDASRIFEPLLPITEAPAALTSLLRRFQDFLDAYRRGNFAQAVRLLDEYEAACGNSTLPCNITLVALYRNRLQELLDEPPVHWDGIHTFTDK